MRNLASWASGIRTREYSSQSAAPYHLAIALESFSHSAPLQKQEKELCVIIFLLCALQVQHNLCGESAFK